MAETASRRLYRTADDRVVFEGDPDAAFLLVNVGQEIPEGYEEPKAKSVAKTEDKSVARDADKAVRRSSAK